MREALASEGRFGQFDLKSRPFENDSICGGLHWFRDRLRPGARRERNPVCFQTRQQALWKAMAAPPKDMEPRWPAMLALLAIGGLRLTLPKSLSLGPDWLMLVLVAILLVPTVMAHMRGNHKLNQILGYLLTSIVTIDMAWSLFLLIKELPSHKESPQTLLLSAAALWITNILVFASWYWRLDAGGPLARAIQGVHTDGAFLFPQMTLNQAEKKVMGEETWNPGFIDYLFLAFNTSTAFSPTDTPVLSRWAKILVMIQSLISLATVALLAARAVNIL
jgi:hypothetical protein